MRRLILLFCLIAVGAIGAAPLEPSAVEREVDAYLQPLLDEDLISGSVLIARTYISPSAVAISTQRSGCSSSLNIFAT